MTNFSRSKIQCCKSAEFTRTIGQSCVINGDDSFCSDNLVFRRTSTSTSGRHFLLNHAKSCIFVTVLPTLFPFLLFVLKGHTTCSKEYDSPGGLCTAQIDESYWSTSNSGRLHGPPCFFFICLVAGLRNSQSQALNSTSLRDKL